MADYNFLSDKEWKLKIDFFRDNYNICKLCPRQCEASRTDDREGVCGAGKEVKIASYNLHFGEEPPVSGKNGSGTIFFSGCTLKCIFCQNYPISQLRNGEIYSIEDLSEIFLGLQKRGAHNLNFVSPTPYLYHIVKAIYLAEKKGLNIPVVYNTSGYERKEIIEKLDGIVDVYMPDFKYSDEKLSLKYSGVKDYMKHADPAIGEMFKQQGELKIDEFGIAENGVIIRHLILPGNVKNSQDVLKIISKRKYKGSYLSLMSQFFPAYRSVNDKDLKRRLYSEEYEKVRSLAISLGFEKGWFQDI
ncbi:MAG: radical SAM protein [Acidobacteriota bacterium]